MMVGQKHLVVGREFCIWPHPPSEYAPDFAESILLQNPLGIWDLVNRIFGQSLSGRINE